MITISAVWRCHNVLSVERLLVHDSVQKRGAKVTKGVAYHKGKLDEIKNNDRRVGIYMWQLVGTEYQTSLKRVSTFLYP